MKELRILLKSIHDLLLKENRADRMNSMQREIDILTGRLESEEKRRRALERYLKVELEEAKFIKVH